ncbi:4'-phosphopantetheinyl transferase superfamily protein [Streptomyces sp. HB132]|uniref:4'-phosphopantetheinyl transferase family protein n=1 Tax=Streptomyces sp. HB132 TaxID=767388 RepID=UPI0019606AE7|nr:4'-phosphopantetheinyl transferase superfamily protein [Streptomyces sp. HB132]MBM7440675.1 4'-phosphopantetheinyl transferase EntD [Streptomyces sp. HB132]
MIEHILPAGVRFAEAFDDDLDPGLFPEEEALVARAVQKRRSEFGTVRRCARAALATLGIPSAPLLPGRRGEPRWPVGIVGSMTHCVGYRGAVVAPSAEFVSLGIDAEPDEQLPPDVLSVVSLPEERDRIDRQARAGEGTAVHADRLLFSAKEAVFKAWYPLTRQELDFTEASISFAYATARSGTFDARLLVPGPELEGRRLDGFTGRWAAARGLVLTAIAVSTGDTASRGPGDPGGLAVV